MLLCEVALVVLIISLVKAQDRYIIPEPKIEVFTPKGFRVSIQDSPGVRLFAFHGNINSELKNLEAGSFSRDIIHKENGRWTFEDRSTRLVVGDTINYWLFVIKDGLGYRLDDGMFKVRELVTSPFSTTTTSPLGGFYPLQTEPPSDQKHSQTDNNINEQRPPSSTTSITGPLPPSPSSGGGSFGEGECQSSILNITNNLLSLQTRIEELIKSNQQLTKVIERMQDSKRLTLGGRIPPDGDAIATVTFLLRERLELNPAIISAERSGNSIVFEVATIAEKLEILDVAPEKLKNSKITIT